MINNKAIRNSNNLQNTSGLSVQSSNTLKKKHQETFDYFCEMRYTFSYKLVSFYQLTKQNTLQTGRSFCEIAK